MLPHTSRIDVETFKRVFPIGRTLSTKNMSLRYAPLETTKGVAFEPRFAVIVTKKVEKLAVKRNAVRRKVYAWIGDMLKTTPIKPAYYIFQVKKPVLEELDFLIKNAKI